MSETRIPIDIDSLPVALRPRFEHHWQGFLDRLDEGQRQSLEDAGWLADLPRVWAISHFCAEQVTRNPELLFGLAASGELDRPIDSLAQLTGELDTLLAAVESEEQLASALRRFRQRQMVRVAWREIAGHAPLEESLRETSWLAECCVDSALKWLYSRYCNSWGVPRSEAGEAQQMVVLGMGKLGGWELNFSSDIDLIYAYPERGETDGKRPISNEEFFTRLGRALTGAIDRTTHEGFVFRVDLRLRPYGDSGPLVMSFDALENYYQSQGRSWERYAMIKARVIAGDRSAGVELIELLRPFVYRRYLDFGAFESLREMKSMIERELARKGMEENIKLGPGGIREVEFIAQALQLIFGGRQSELRERRLLAVLDRLAASDHLPRFAVERLASAYRFLRALENRLQQFRDEQTQSLPTDSDGQARIAYALGFSDWHAFGKELGRQRRHVAEQFAQTFAAPQAEEGGDAAASPALLGLWRGELEESDALRVLGEHGFIRADEALRRLQLLRKGRARRATGDQGRRWLDRLIPLLIGATGAGGEPDEPFTRILDLIEVIAGRTAYLALLVENPMALSQLVTLFAGSPWIADYLLRHPALIDELLDPRTLYRPLTREELSADLQRRLDGVAGNDQEGQMEALRHFKHPNVLRVAAADIAGAFKLMKVSDYLTWIAELTVEAAFCASRQQIESRHGRARCQVDGVERQATMLVIGYGKLGGIELGYGSDLDLVFIHDSEGSGQQTDGERPVDNATCFARIGQRLIHMLDTLTPSGILYEVDMRLRPHGNSGPLVASFDAYADYLRREAWTWEHQALVRARAITAAQASELAGRFDQLRGEILCRERDLSTLRSEVVEMRRKMRESLDRSQDGIFDLKQGVSGIVDIEFIVQFLVLAHAARHPELARWSDDIHLLEELGRAGLLAIGEVESLADAFRAYRARLHRCKLQEGSGLVDESLFAAERAAVASVWQRLMIIG